MTTLDTLVLVPLREMLLKVVSFVPSLLSAIVILIVGLLIAKFLRDILHQLFKEIKLNKLADKVGLSELFHKGGIKSGLGDLICTLIHLVVVFMFVIMALESLGMVGLYALLGSMTAYLPHVVSAVFILVFGMIIANIVAHVIYAVACNLSMPKPKMLRKISHIFIIIYAAKASLMELGFSYLFVGPVFHIWFAGLVLALAIAFGLGGRDTAAGYFSKKK